MDQSSRRCVVFHGQLLQKNSQTGSLVVGLTDLEDSGLDAEVCKLDAEMVRKSRGFFLFLPTRGAIIPDVPKKAVELLSEVEDPAKKVKSYSQVLRAAIWSRWEADAELQELFPSEPDYYEWFMLETLKTIRAESQNH